MICAYNSYTLYVLLLKVPIFNINTYNCAQRFFIHKLNYILESVLGSMQTRRVYYIVYRLIIAKHAVYGLKF